MQMEPITTIEERKRWARMSFGERMSERFAAAAARHPNWAMTATVVAAVATGLSVAHVIRPYMPGASPVVYKQNGPIREPVSPFENIC